MKKFWIGSLLAFTIVIGCAEPAEISRHGYSTRYEIPPLGTPSEIKGTLYFRGTPLVNDIGYAAIKRDGSRAVFVHEQKLYYTKDGDISQIDLLHFAPPVDVIWKKYQVEILFADQEPYTLEIF